MSWTGRVRAGSRMGLFAASTLYHLAKLKASQDDRARRTTVVAHQWGRQLVRLLGVDVECTGTVPTERVLLLANHRSYIDIPVILSQMPCAFLAKEEIGEWPIIGAAARANHTVFVKREDPTSRKASREGVLGVLRQKASFAAFPEGTTSHGPGMKPFFPGLFELAADNRIPVVPAAIEYGARDDAWIDDDPFLAHFLRRFDRPRMRVALHFGPLLAPGDPRVLKSRCEEWIQGALGRPVAEPAPRRVGGRAALRPA